MNELLKSYLEQMKLQRELINLALDIAIKSQENLLNALYDNDTRTTKHDNR
jgi:DNA replication protein DnaD